MNAYQIVRSIAFSQCLFSPSLSFSFFFSILARFKVFAPCVLHLDFIFLRSKHINVAFLLLILLFLLCLYIEGDDCIE